MVHNKPKAETALCWNNIEHLIVAAPPNRQDHGTEHHKKAEDQNQNSKSASTTLCARNLNILLASATHFAQVFASTICYYIANSGRNLICHEGSFLNMTLITQLPRLPKGPSSPQVARETLRKIIITTCRF